jgi:glutamate--cysteine ligase
LTLIEERLRALSPQVLRGIRRGIEKESLRVRSDGALAMTPHPVCLGSALTHPHITTDYSEAQLELITGAHETPEACLKELTQIHQFVYRCIGEEMLWVASMPCSLPQDDDIPLGRYGTSNIGRMKTVYRMGLAYRYGRRMQTISGIHYNWSLPEARWPAALGAPNEAYFALIRNFRRHSWLLLYLFGASPAVCASFVAGRKHELQVLKDGTLHMPYGTSLRMGRLGYQSEAQASLCVSYNSLESYGASLEDALTKPYPPYEKIGVRAGEEYRQLSTSLLQIENEFYGTIRPKRVIRSGERPLHALRSRGVEYVEVRCMDLDPFLPAGISTGTMRFLDVFLLHCLLSESPPDTRAEIGALGRNQQRAAALGREPGLRLEKGAGTVSLADWGRSLLGECAPIAAALDAAHGGTPYRDALGWAGSALDNPGLVPSARVLAEVRERHDGSYTRFALECSEAHRAALAARPLSRAFEARMQRAADASLEEQRRIEAADDVPFEEYRQRYLAQELLLA